MEACACRCRPDCFDLLLARAAALFPDLPCALGRPPALPRSGIPALLAERGGAAPRDGLDPSLRQGPRLGNRLGQPAANAVAVLAGHPRLRPPRPALARPQLSASDPCREAEADHVGGGQSRCVSPLGGAHAGGNARGYQGPAALGRPCAPALRHPVHATPAPVLRLRHPPPPSDSDSAPDPAWFPVSACVSGLLSD